MSENRPLRLEWRSPSELADNPKNWREHPEAQTAALEAVVSEVGWAGAMLFNERTGRLIDGHARKRLPAECLVDGKVPVLIGDWSEADERKILLTLDPLAAMAEANKQALGELMAGLETDSEAVQKMMEGLAAENDIDLFADGSLPADADGKEFDESCANDVEMTECPSCGHKFPK